MRALIDASSIDAGHSEPDAYVSTDAGSAEPNHDSGDGRDAGHPADACANHACDPPPICSLANVCEPVDYPCEPLSNTSYRCRGQLLNGPPLDSPNTFVDNGDGTVHDSRTNLTWQQTVTADQYTYQAGQTHCESLSLAGGGWRLPTVAELVSLSDFTKFPPIDTNFFPGTVDGFITHSSTLGYDSTMYSVWTVAGGLPQRTDLLPNQGPQALPIGAVRCVR